MDPERDRRSGLDPALSRRERRRRRSRTHPARRLRATRAGWCFIAILFGVGFAALNTGNNLLYLVLALMLAFLVLSGLLSETSLRGLRIERRLPRELFADAPSRIVLRVHNDQRRVAAFAISLEDRFESAAGPGVAGRTFLLRIPPSGEVDRSYAFEPPRRGPLRWTGIRISTRFPFGLFVKSAELACAAEALVYPRIDPVPLAPRLAGGAHSSGEQPRTSRSGEQIVGLRDFTPGDSRGRVHWRRSLRARKWLVGERQEETSRELEIRLEPEPADPEPVVEERISRAASQIVQHLEDGWRVGLRTPRERFIPEAGRRQRSALLSCLARFDVHAGAPEAHSEEEALG